MQSLSKRARACSGHAVALTVGLLALSSTCQTVRAPLDPHLSTQANLVRLEASILANSQFSHHPLDRELAVRLFDTYLDALDERHSLFLQSDVDAFARSVPDLSSAIRAGDTRLAFEIRARYLQRLAQRAHYVRGLLDGLPFQFTSDERYQLDRTDAPRPKDLAAARALWGRHLRADYLDEKLDGTEPDQIAPKLAQRYEQQLLTARSLRDRISVPADVADRIKKAAGDTPGIDVVRAPLRRARHAGAPHPRQRAVSSPRSSDAGCATGTLHARFSSA